MNYFQYHGATFCQNLMKIACYFPKINPEFDRSNPNYYTGEFIKVEETNSWKFVYKNKLYSFWSDKYGRIDRFSDLTNIAAHLQLILYICFSISSGCGQTEC